MFEYDDLNDHPMAVFHRGELSDRFRWPYLKGRLDSWIYKKFDTGCSPAEFAIFLNEKIVRS